MPTPTITPGIAQNSTLVFRFDGFTIVVESSELSSGVLVSIIVNVVVGMIVEVVNVVVNVVANVDVVEVNDVVDKNVVGDLSNASHSRLIICKHS